jgi:hypothetical protein
MSRVVRAREVGVMSRVVAARGVGVMSRVVSRTTEFLS